MEKVFNIKITIDCDANKHLDSEKLLEDTGIFSIADEGVNVEVTSEVGVEWIDVNDSLPELDSSVLCLNQDMSIEKGSYINNYWTGNKPGFLDEQDEQPGRIYPAKWMYVNSLVPNQKLV